VRYLVLLLFGYALLIVEGTVMVFIPLSAAAPDLVLLVVVAAALSRRGAAPTHAAFACAMGYVADVLGGGPRGVLAFTFVVISLLGRFFSRRVYINRLWGRALAALVCAAASGAVVTVVQSIVMEGVTLRSFALIPVHATSTALVSPLVIGVCRRIDSALGIVIREPLRW
jgi:rod shape-determining protein MreD